MAPEQTDIDKVRQALHIPARKLPQPTLVLLSGLPGTGKSYLAHQLAQRVPLVVITSDQVRHLLFPEPDYSPNEHHIVHATCQEVIRRLLQEGHSVICDATNLTRRHRQRYYALAEECRAQTLIVETVAAPDVVRKRLQQRDEGSLPTHGSDADWSVYLDYCEKTEPIRRPHRVVDTSGDIDRAVGQLCRHLEGAPAPLPPNPRARLVLNPAAGQSHRLGDLDETIGYLVRQGWEISLKETREPNEAIQLARQAAEEGLDVVVAIGGDGTVNEVVNGLAGTATALAVIPMGSGNVWAREQGLPPEPVEAAHALAQGRIRSVDLGLAGSRYFLLMASVGFDAEVVRSLSGEAKQTLWPLGYILRGIDVAIDFAGKETVITLDDRQVAGETVLVVIGNTRMYGVIAQITPRASIDDGLLDVCIFRGKGGLPLISLFALVVILQRPELIRNVDLYRAREVTVSSQPPLGVQTDGEPIGITPMTFKAVPRALRVLVPRNVQPGLFSHP